MNIPGKRLDAFLARTVDGFVILFGLWSLLSQAVVLGGGNARTLARLSLAAAVLGAAALILLAKKGSLLPRGPEFPPEKDSAAAFSGDAEKPLRPAFAALAGAILLALFYAWTGLFVPFWIAAAAFLGIYYARSIGAPAFRPARADVGPVGLAAFALIALLAVGAALFVHRPQADDSFYLSVAVSVHDHPEAPIMAWDTLNGSRGQPFLAPQHRIRTYEVLVGLASRALGIEPIAAAHLLFPPLFALLFVAAAARFLRLLLGRAWLFGLAAVVVLLLVNGDTDSTYGNTAFVLLFQGKAILTMVMVPILAAYGLEYAAGLRPPAAVAGLLVLALAGSISLSTNGLFMGPIAAGLAMAGAWRPDRRSSLRLILGGIIFLYPVGLGLLLRGTAVPELYYHVQAPSWLLEARRGLNLVLGWRAFESFWLTALLGGWVFFPDRARRRFFLGAALFFVLVFMNPLLTGFWARHVTSSVTFFRLYWAVPLPFFLAALLAGPLLRVSRRRAGAAGLAFGLFLAGFAALVPARWTVSPINRARIEKPGLKVPTTFFRTALLLSQRTAPGRSVLAPEPVAEWIPTLSGHPPTVVSRLMYLNQQYTRMDKDEYQLRLRLSEYVSGASRKLPREDMEKQFCRGIEELRIGSVAVIRSNRWLGDIDPFLRGRGFRRIASPSRHFLLYILP